MPGKKNVTITLSYANAGDVKIIAKILKKPVSYVVSYCLKGSTNPNSSKSLR